MKTIAHFCVACLAATFLLSTETAPVALGADWDTVPIECSVAEEFNKAEELVFDDIFIEKTVSEESSVVEEIRDVDTTLMGNDSEVIVPAQLTGTKLPDVKEDSPDGDVTLETYSFFTESEGHAQNIAQSMGGDLLSFQYGIATLQLAPSEIYRRSKSGSVKFYPEYEYTVSEMHEVQPPLEAPKDNSMEQWHFAFLNTTEAQKTSAGKGISVAVIDTGIDSSHEDLVAAVAAAESTIPETSYGELGMFPAEYQGGGDNLGHGTHVAGIIGARKNGIGCTGIAPESSIFSIKALERSGTQGKGRSSWVAAAVAMAVEQGVDIINLSVGGTVIKDELLLISIQKALDAGIAVVCAAGNTDTPVLMYPGAYEGTIAVSAVKAQGETVTFASGYSNSGDWIDFSAPGSNILSTVPGGYAVKTGTSMACPMVSGALALMLSADPLLTSEQAIQILRQSARDFGDPGKDSRYGYGVLDLQAMTELHQQRLFPDLPVSSIPTGSTVFQGSPISISTDTLHGNVVYTLDNSEPARDGTVWPNAPVVFSEETEQITITARTISDNGAFGTCVQFSYRFVPKVMQLTQDSGIVSDVIPRYGISYQDPVLNLPCRRYQIQLEANQVLCITPPPEGSDVQYALFDAEGSGAKRIGFTKTPEGLLWRNDSEQTRTVFLSLTLKETCQASQDIPYSFQFSRQNVPEEIIPVETEPGQTEDMKPEETKETKPTLADVPATQSTQSQSTHTAKYAGVSTTKPVFQPILETNFPEFEEDWLYVMDEPAETTPTTHLPDQFSEKGGKTPMDAFDLRFLLAGGIILLFGLALFLLGYFTGRKSWRLLRYGENADATVLRITRCSDYHTFRYQVSYRTKSGQQITALWNVYPRIRFVRRHAEGSIMGIKYLPESPKEFMVLNHPTGIISSVCCLTVGIGVILLGIRIACLMFTLG